MSYHAKWNEPSDEWIMILPIWQDIQFVTETKDNRFHLIYYQPSEDFFFFWMTKPKRKTIKDPQNTMRTKNDSKSMKHWRHKAGFPCKVRSAWLNSLLVPGPFLAGLSADYRRKAAWNYRNISIATLATKQRPIYTSERNVCHSFVDCHFTPILKR